MKRAPDSKPVRFLEWSYQSQAPLKTLWRWADCHFLRSIWMLIVFTVKQSPQWIIPIVFATVIDKLDNPDSISDRGLIILLIATAASMGGNIPLHTYYITQLSQITRRLERRLRQALAVRLQQLSIPYHDDTESGKLQAKVLRDVEQVHMISHHLGEAGVTIMMSIFWIIIYTGIRKPAVLLVYLVMVPVVIALRQIFSNRIRKENRAFRQKVEKMNSEVSQMIEMIPVSRAHGIEDVATHRATSEFNRVKDQGQRLDKLNALFQSSSWVTFQVANLMIFLVFAYLCYLDQISLGEVVLFEQLFRQIMMSFNMIMGIYPQLAKGLESIRSIGEVLECPDMEENQGKIPIDQVTGRIEYQNLGYTYRGETLPALSNIHLTIEPGECVAVVGPSGGGKSTLMRLTIGFRRPTAGKIVLDGIDMENIDMRTWRRFISVVPQESVLFEGSIRDNILFGLSSIEEEHFEDILQASNVREFVDKLPHGLDTMVGESGARLSGGQRQRLAIARALVRDPRVIVLDEPTSALDVMSEKYVQEAIDRLVKDRTTLIVAHRLSTIRNADRIVVLEDGKIVEMGTYAELIAKPDGAFKHMKDLQE